MTQVNKISTTPKIPFQVGEKVRCGLFPEMTLTIHDINGRKACIRTPKGNLFDVSIHRLSRA